MLIVPDAFVRHISEAIVMATHELLQTTGARAAVDTIDPARLRQVSITAVALAVGQTVIPDNEKITIRRTDQVSGPFVIQAST